MASTIAENATKIVLAMYKGEQDQQWRGHELAAETDLVSAEINNAVAVLEDNGFVELMRFLGTAPYDFGYVSITPRGRFAVEQQADARNERMTSEEKPSAPVARPLSFSPSVAGAISISAPPAPIGSPFGFTDQDWELVASRRGDATHLNVVFGCQFKSEHYDTPSLAGHLQSMLTAAVATYNAQPTAVKAQLNFLSLHAGYGEHLFNEIARDIIAADIAIFDTSDLNPNVMLEMGVALTWGVRVLPVKKNGCAKPPSGIDPISWTPYSP